MRHELQQDPRPEFGIPVPQDTGAAGRHTDTAAGRPDPWSGPQPSAPWSGPTPAPAPFSGPGPAAGPYSGPQPAAGPYSGPQPAAARTASTGSWPAADRAPAGYPAPGPGVEPTVRHPRTAATAHDVAPAGFGAAGRERAGYEPAGYERAGYEPAGYEPAGYDPHDGHPSGPLPVGSGHRRGERRPAVARGGRGRRRAVLALIAAGAVVAGAAGYVAIARASAHPDAPAAAAGGAQVAGATLSGPNLATRQTPLGLVATSDGFTVYEYTKDSNKPSASTCTGSCATSWPPVLASDTPWLKGVSADEVGSVDRPDGTKQLTLNGWPLYRYAKDTAPGDTSGNGVGGTWKALGPEGKPVAPNAPAAGAAPAAGGSGGSGGSGGTAGASGGYGTGSGSSGAYGSAPAPASSGDSYGGSSGGY